MLYYKSTALARCSSRPGREFGLFLSIFLCSFHYEYVAAENFDHFPCIVRIVALCCAHFGKTMLVNSFLLYSLMVSPFWLAMFVAMGIYRRDTQRQNGPSRTRGGCPESVHRAADRQVPQRIRAAQLAARLRTKKRVAFRSPARLIGRLLLRSVATSPS